MPPSKREDLIDAAMCVFYKVGFNASSLDDIQKEGKVSRMTLYNHFKSKDELIIAAMRRRDEIFRNKLMKFVESKAKSPMERIAAVFDFHEEWFKEEDFCGCMFINASAEFSLADSAPRRIAAEHKQDIVRYLKELCTHAGVADPDEVAQQLNILIEGSIVTARVVGQVADGGAAIEVAAQRAKRMGMLLLEEK